MSDILTDEQVNEIKDNAIHGICADIHETLNLIATLRHYKAENERLNGVIDKMDECLVRSGKQYMDKEIERAEVQYQLEVSQQENARLQAENEGLKLSRNVALCGKGHFKDENSRLREALKKLSTMSEGNVEPGYTESDELIAEGFVQGVKWMASLAHQSLDTEGSTEK